MLEVMDPKSRQLQCFLTLSALFKTFHMSHAVEDLTSHVTLVTSSLNCNYVISHCHYLLNSKSNREGENFLFVPLLLAECFLTVLGETNSQEISLNTAVNRPRK